MTVKIAHTLIVVAALALVFIGIVEEVQADQKGFGVIAYVVPK